MLTGAKARLTKPAELREVLHLRGTIRVKSWIRQNGSSRPGDGSGRRGGRAGSAPRGSAPRGSPPRPRAPRTGRGWHRCRRRGRRSGARTSPPPAPSGRGGSRRRPARAAAGGTRDGRDHRPGHGSWSSTRRATGRDPPRRHPGHRRRSAAPCRRSTPPSLTVASWSVGMPRRGTARPRSRAATSAGTGARPRWARRTAPAGPPGRRRGAGRGPRPRRTGAAVRHPSSSRCRGRPPTRREATPTRRRADDVWASAVPPGERCGDLPRYRGSAAPLPSPQSVRRA